MVEYGYFDYKRPTGTQNDYRTSTYRGHLKLPEPVSEAIQHDFSIENKQYLQSVGDEERRRTESQEQFSWKIIKPSIVRKPTVERILFMKSFEENRLRNHPKLIKPSSSVSQSDFQWKSKALKEHPPVIHLTTETEENDKSPSIDIDRCKPGFGKLLDPSATTNNLTYRAYSKEESGTTSKNIITFWNWKNKFEKEHTFFKIVKKCSMHPRDYQNSIKHVPNNGFLSEAKSNYVQHFNLTDVDSSHINDQFINYIGVPNEAKSENTIYGSGIRLQKYLP